MRSFPPSSTGRSRESCDVEEAEAVGGRTTPYTGGLADALRCVGMIRSAPLPTRNRLAFLTLDSTLEIAMRLFLKHKKRITLDPLKHRRRDVLIGMMKKNMKQDD